MRFLHLTTFYPPWNFGGNGLFVQQLARALVCDGHHVEVAHCVDAFRTLSEAVPNLNEELADDGIVIHSLKSNWGHYPRWGHIRPVTLFSKLQSFGGSVVESLM